MSQAGSERLRPVLPGSTLGIFGSGQLGRMLAIAARHMGYRVQVFSPDRDSPTGQVADREWVADYHDLEKVTAFARAVDVITLEFENIPTVTVESARKQTAVYPDDRVLHTLQNRVREKSFLASVGLPVPPFAAIRSRDELESAGPSLFPGVLKTTEMGYDGKGQVMVDSLDDAVAGWDRLKTHEAILEQRIEFECELSVVAARRLDGSTIAYDPIRNDHRNHILDVSVSPAGFSDTVDDQARELARQVMEQLDYVGLLCVEFFLAPGNQLLINEIAPRPHNSGHLTIEAHATSQFEQQLRAVCGLPFGSTQQIVPAAMCNLLGDLWQTEVPAWARALEHTGTSLHLYGKSEAKPGRKMGHLTATAASVDEAVAVANAARQSLSDG